ncbi:DUF4838 domain-containing protein [Flavobacterium sp.]|uniref:DUF4838 domain-containing protein n=1 Tax=Flavobacterium sp. TaxID=239 RepID=UPI00262CA18B|nr:DUF4838 domain-containing protein [Flavobacterium sp.]
MRMIVLQTLLFTLLFSCGNATENNQAIAYDYYVINKADETNEDFVNYLYTHFKKRSETTIILKQGSDIIPNNNSSIQYIDAFVDKKLNTDYEVQIYNNQLVFKAKSKKTLYWLYYQYFKALSKIDSKINAHDLPPALLNFSQSTKGNFAFEYREPHLKANLNDDYDGIINTNNVEKDWGIWGHQLFNLINRTPQNQYYSIVDGEINKNQLCFSNPATYTFIENYIIDQFGENENYVQKFVISPADNGIACTCESCSKLGNTKGNASASVIALVNKLAKRFPVHQFFTLDYLSVKTPPKNKMAPNTGVIISSIDIPRRTKLDANNEYVKEFESKVHQWKKVASSVYVWDYISNFDDYLTPFATLAVCKTNFQFYKKLNITGIFGNGAGYDYSTFNEVHTYVMAALMQNPDLEIEPLVNKFCNYYYGDSGAIIATYILGLEKEMQTHQYKLDLYNGVKKITGTYMNKPDFFDFYNTIGQLKEKQNPEIKNRLNQLYTALTYTSLQIQLANKLDETYGFGSMTESGIQINEDFKSKLNLFSELYKANEILVTRETEGTSSNYIKDVQSSIIESKLPANLLQTNSLKIISELDEDYTDFSLLVDAIPGLITDYHNAWLIVSASDFVAEINVPNEGGNYHFKFNFLQDERLKMRAPQKIEIFINNKIAKIIKPENAISEFAKRLTLESTVLLKKNDRIKVKIYRDETYKKFACDEIYLYK